MSDDFERDPLSEIEHVNKPFDPRKVSPSRVNALSECGVAFRRKYIDGDPPTRMGSFALNGTVIHAALEKWAVNRSQDLLTLMRQAWLAETVGTPVADFLAEYQTINVSVLKAEQAARVAYEANPRNKGKKSAAPRMTKHFKESAPAKQLAAMMRKWEPRLSAESPWEFSERDPLPQFYDDSLVIARRYQKVYGHLPPTLHTEFAFSVEWRGFLLTGYIDSIEPVMTTAGELLGIGPLDYKTYRREPAQHKDYRQMVMYDIAIREMVKNGTMALPLDTTDLLVGIDYVKQTGTESDWKVLLPEDAPEGATSGGKSRAYWKMEEADYDRLERELKNYFGIVDGGFFQPAAKSTNPDFCDYGESCCLRNVGGPGGCATRVEVTI